MKPRHAPAKPTREYHHSQLVAKLTNNPRRDDATLASLMRSHRVSRAQIDAIDAEIAAARNA